MRSCFLSGFVEFHSAVPEEKSKMSQPIRGQGGHLIFPIIRKNTNLVEDIEILLPVKFPWIPFSGLRSHSHCEKNCIIDMSVCKFGNWLRDRSLMIGDILYIIGKGISIALKRFFFKDQKSKYAPDKIRTFYCSFIKPSQGCLPDFGPRYHN